MIALVIYITFSILFTVGQTLGSTIKGEKFSLFEWIFGILISSVTFPVFLGLAVTSLLKK